MKKDNPLKLWPGIYFDMPRHYERYETNPHCAGCDSYLVGGQEEWICPSGCKKSAGEAVMNVGEKKDSVKTGLNIYHAYWDQDGLGLFATIIASSEAEAIQLLELNNSYETLKDISLIGLALGEKKPSVVCRESP